MTDSSPQYEVYALHVGDKWTTRSEFLYRDPSQDRLLISFYFWVVLGGDEPIVYDVTFGPEHAERRRLHEYRDRAEMLNQLGVNPDDVRTVVMSHLHWDHWSGHGLFRNARFVVQGTEAAFWTGPASRYELVMASANRPELEAMLRLHYDGRIQMIEGERCLWPGIDLVPVGGHTPGIQIMVIRTARGNVVLANDTMHFYENLDRRRLVQVTMDFPRALQALETVAERAGPEGVIIPGHDPLVRERFPEIAPGIYRIA